MFRNDGKVSPLCCGCVRPHVPLTPVEYPEHTASVLRLKKVGGQHGLTHPAVLQTLCILSRKSFQYGRASQNYIRIHLCVLERPMLSVESSLDGLRRCLYLANSWGGT